MNMSLNICYYLSKFFFQTLYFDIKYDYYSTQNIIRHINENLKISQSVKLLQHLQLQVTKKTWSGTNGQGCSPIIDIKIQINKIKDDELTCKSSQCEQHQMMDGCEFHSMSSIPGRQQAKELKHLNNHV